jgi:hypothetical protein
MIEKYIFQRPVRKPRYAIFLRRFRILIFVIIVAILAGVWLFYSSRHTATQKPISSQAENKQIAPTMNTFSTPYFKFQDTGKWVLNTVSSTKTMYLFNKWHGIAPLYHLSVYVNETPIPLYLQSSRALPVRIVNGNSFDPTGVSAPCLQFYGPHDIQQVKEVSVSGANMLCSPTTPELSVVLTQIGGDYRFHLQRPNGTQAQYVITFLDQTGSSDFTPLMNIASSFQTL